MAGGLNGTGLFGGNVRNVCHEDHFVNRYEAAQSARIAELETEVKLRDSYIYTDKGIRENASETNNKILDLYKYVDGKFARVEHELCDQKVYNATNTATISCIQNQVAQLAALTKVVIPITSVCPEPMPQYNSWTAPTATAGA